MIPINRLREFLVEKKDQITEINYTQLVIDDSQFASIVKERDTCDNCMMIAVLPMHEVIGKQDQEQIINSMLFFFVEKQADKDNNHDDFIDVFARTQAVAKKFIDLILEEKSNDNTICGILSDIIEDSIVIETVWSKAQTHGYMVAFDIKSKL
jgi:hypothetical protein